MKDVEIEIQTRVENVKPLIEFLKKEGEKVFEDHQKDEYYTPFHRNFFATKPIDEWLRIRESGKNSITYKNWHHNAEGKSNHCDEFETTIGNTESLRKIFKVLDIKPVITVDKNRQSWNYKDYEVSIDHIVNLGDFVEVEYKGHEAVDPDKTAKEMIEFLKSVKVGKVEINYVGYPFLMLYPEENHFELV